MSETNIVEHIQKLEDIGYRVIGTDEAVLGEVLYGTVILLETTRN